MADEASAEQAITIKSGDGETVTIRPEAILAIITASDMKSTSLLLQGGFTVALRGTGEGIRKKAFGLSPEAVKIAVSQRAAGQGPNGQPAGKNRGRTTTS